MAIGNKKETSMFEIEFTNRSYTLKKRSIYEKLMAGKTNANAKGKPKTNKSNVLFV